MTLSGNMLWLFEVSPGQGQELDLILLGPIELSFFYHSVILQTYTALWLLNNRIFCTPFIENHAVYGFKLLSFQFYCNETCGSLCRKWRICNFMTECENYHSWFCLFFPVLLSSLPLLLQGTLLCQPCVWPYSTGYPWQLGILLWMALCLAAQAVN